MIEHTFNPGTQEAKAGKALVYTASSKLARTKEWDPYLKIKQ